MNGGRPVTTNQQTVLLTLARAITQQTAILELIMHSHYSLLDLAIKLFAIG